MRGARSRPGRRRAPSARARWPAFVASASRQRGRNACSAARRATCTSTCARSKPARRASVGGTGRKHFDSLVATGQRARAFARVVEKAIDVFARVRLGAQQREARVGRQLRGLALRRAASSAKAAKSCARAPGRADAPGKSVWTSTSPGRSRAARRGRPPASAARTAARPRGSRRCRARCRRPARRPASAAESRGPWRASACRPGCRPRRRRTRSRTAPRTRPCARGVASRCARCAPRESSSRERLLDALRAAARPAAGRRCRSSGRRAASLAWPQWWQRSCVRRRCTTRRAVQRVQSRFPRARRAVEHRRVAAAVDEQQRLLAARDARARARRGSSTDSPSRASRPRTGNEADTRQRARARRRARAASSVR